MRRRLAGLLVRVGLGDVLIRRAYMKQRFPMGATRAFLLRWLGRAAMVVPGGQRLGVRFLPCVLAEKRYEIRRLLRDPEGLTFAVETLMSDEENQR